MDLSTDFEKLRDIRSFVLNRNNITTALVWEETFSLNFLLVLPLCSTYLWTESRMEDPGQVHLRRDVDGGEVGGQAERVLLASPSVLVAQRRVVDLKSQKENFS